MKNVWIGVLVAVVIVAALAISSGHFGQAPTASAHKCVQNGKVLYSNQPCPSAMSQQALTAGTVSVLPAAKETKPAAAAASMSASATPLLRRLAGPDETAEIKERRIEQAIGR